MVIVGEVTVGSGTAGCCGLSAVGEQTTMGDTMAGKVTVAGRVQDDNGGSSSLVPSGIKSCSVIAANGSTPILLI